MMRVAFDEEDSCGFWFEVAMYYEKVNFIGHNFEFDCPKVIYWKHITANYDLFARKL